MLLIYNYIGADKVGKLSECNYRMWLAKQLNMFLVVFLKPHLAGKSWVGFYRWVTSSTFVSQRNVWASYNGGRQFTDLHHCGLDKLLLEDLHAAGLHTLQLYRVAAMLPGLRATSGVTFPSHRPFSPIRTWCHTDWGPSASSIFWLCNLGSEKSFS